MSAGRRAVLLGAATMVTAALLALPGVPPGRAAQLRTVGGPLRPVVPARVLDPVAGAGDPGGAGLTGPPTRLRIPALRVDTPLVALGLDAAGALIPPADFQRAGWYAAGTLPGDVGPAVIAGHVDSRTGPAVFVRLRELTAGALVEVERDGQWVAFRVVAVDRYAKDAFPTNTVYGPTPGPELRLVTCGGDFNRQRGSYLDNVVVYAIRSA